MENLSRADVLVDADNITTQRAETVASLVDDAEGRGQALRHVHIVGRTVPVLVEYERLFRVRCPRANVSTAAAWPGNNVADILAGIWLGRLSHELAAYTGPYELYVLTRDKLVLRTARYALGKETTLVIPDDVQANYGEAVRTLALPRPHGRAPAPAETAVSIPHWALDQADPSECVGLHWAQSAEALDHPQPAFVPFPARLATVRLGSGGGNLDVDLSPWDKIGSLYAPHVVFEYAPAPTACWTMRATHGHRTGKRKVAVGNALLSAASAPTTLHTGTRMELGDFSFTFQDNARLNYVWFEDPKDLVERLERGFRRLVEHLPPEALPDTVRSDLNRAGRFSWDHAYLRSYEEVFASVFGKSLVPWVDETFESKSEMQRSLGALNRIRNTVFHPSREPLGESDRERLADLYLRFAGDDKAWPS
ncbi:MAG: hypothetical protein AB7S70_10800 [Hyphomicrobium sp.]|uniref:hypothetical protein n=1 Tax=Hyphomicrobium sp. TaxID=82 RepID=UPI003D1045B6